MGTMCYVIGEGHAGRPCRTGLRGRLVVPGLVLLLLLSVGAAAAAQWVYDDYLTLALSTADRADGTRVRADALLPRETVEAWTDASMAATAGEGAKNPGFCKSRGYRVRIVVTRDGVPLGSTRHSGGVGPLADRVGVFTTRVAGHQVWMRSGHVRAEFSHPAGAPSAEYEITWIIDCRPARSERLRLPADEAAQPEPQEMGLFARDGRGLYPPGTAPGVPYPFTQVAPPARWPAEGAGLIVASLSPEEARGYLGLPQSPRAPVLIGWQPDGADCLAWFYSVQDADISLRPPPAEVRPLAQGQAAETHSAPQAFRLEGSDGAPVAVMALGPEARLARTAVDAVELVRGALRVSVHSGAVTIGARGEALVASGLALVEVDESRTRAWCLTREIAVGGVRLVSGEMVTVGAAGPVTESFDLSQMRDVFLSTCLVAGDNGKTRETPEEEVARANGVIRDVILCEGLDGAQRPVNPGTVFGAGTSSISVIVGYRTPGRTRAQITLSLLREGVTKTKSTTEVSGSGKFVAAFRAAGDGVYGPGKWQIRLSVDGRPDREIDFTVQE